MASFVWRKSILTCYPSNTRQPRWLGVGFSWPRKRQLPRCRKSSLRLLCAPYLGQPLRDSSPREELLQHHMLLPQQWPPRTRMRLPEPPLWRTSLLAPQKISMHPTAGTSHPSRPDTACHQRLVLSVALQERRRPLCRLRPSRGTWKTGTMCPWLPRLDHGALRPAWPP